ncbi:hypothetical protein LX15_005083 [Streptoalloteichus tenebrarius]|uniref:Uncharacterized protein n=1 Tax=Streptoalloteichus tenebrarius (strain ATCC 17920 / DSM 40477 / JCM 4838 / CBS 697.72 / NBRC 16177 / NCIMB 11028 / NRRL B-12390 / A12253. 1 / ISP 5477) TaxID=1933 RepID=A0ABT1I0Q0_STRSD|nr:hypothetical protein [Streptoalloteichus tenebrarius]MCP2261359.1 hypothetical protein [Streptoalloteichus tenebrarius]BFF00896.1 hypothetical protein GCM10020241_25710 [Streptoalloteichus tenebrarius]
MSGRLPSSCLVVLTGLVMITMALLVNRLRWWVRALTPVVVWMGALLIQYAV